MVTCAIGTTNLGDTLFDALKEWIPTAYSMPAALRFAHFRRGVAEYNCRSPFMMMKTERFLRDFGRGCQMIQTTLSA